MGGGRPTPTLQPADGRAAGLAPPLEPSTPLAPVTPQAPTLLQPGEGDNPRQPVNPMSPPMGAVSFVPHPPQDPRTPPQDPALAPSGHLQRPVQLLSPGGSSLPPPGLEVREELASVGLTSREPAAQPRAGVLARRGRPPHQPLTRKGSGRSIGRKGSVGSERSFASVVSRGSRGSPYRRASARRAQSPCQRGRRRRGSVTSDTGSLSQSPRGRGSPRGRRRSKSVQVDADWDAMVPEIGEDVLVSFDDQFWPAREEFRETRGDVDELLRIFTAVATTSDYLNEEVTEQKFEAFASEAGWRSAPSLFLKHVQQEARMLSGSPPDGPLPFSAFVYALLIIVIVTNESDLVTAEMIYDTFVNTMRKTVYPYYSQPVPIRTDTGHEIVTRILGRHRSDVRIVAGIDDLLYIYHAPIRAAFDVFRKRKPQNRRGGRDCSDKLARKLYDMLEWDGWWAFAQESGLARSVGRLELLRIAKVSQFSDKEGIVDISIPSDSEYYGRVCMTLDEFTTAVTRAALAIYRHVPVKDCPSTEYRVHSILHALFGPGSPLKLGHELPPELLFPGLPAMEALQPSSGDVDGRERVSVTATPLCAARGVFARLLPMQMPDVRVAVVGDAEARLDTRPFPADLRFRTPPVGLVALRERWVRQERRRQERELHARVARPAAARRADAPASAGWRAIAAGGVGKRGVALQAAAAIGAFTAAKPPRDPIRELTGDAAAAKRYGMRIHMEPTTEGIHVSITPVIHYTVLVRLSNDGRMYCDDAEAIPYTYLERRPQIRLAHDVERYAKQLFGQYCRHEDPYNDAVLSAGKWELFKRHFGVIEPATPIYAPWRMRRRAAAPPGIRAMPGMRGLLDQIEAAHLQHPGFGKPPHIDRRVRLADERGVPFGDAVAGPRPPPPTLFAAWRERAARRATADAAEPDEEEEAEEHPVFAQVAEEHRVRGRSVVGVTFPQFLGLLCRVQVDLFGDLAPDAVGMRVTAVLRGGRCVLPRLRALVEVVEIAAMTRIERLVDGLPRRGRRCFAVCEGPRVVGTLREGAGHVCARGARHAACDWAPCGPEDRRSGPAARVERLLLDDRNPAEFDALLLRLVGAGLLLAPASAAAGRGPLGRCYEVRCGEADRDEDPSAARRFRSLIDAASRRATAAAALAASAPRRGGWAAPTAAVLRTRVVEGGVDDAVDAARIAGHLWDFAGSCGTLWWQAADGEVQHPEAAMTVYGRDPRVHFYPLFGAFHASRTLDELRDRITQRGYQLLMRFSAEDVSRC